MPRRIGRPGLIGTMARTAVISGTATAVSGNVARRQAGRAQSRQEQAYVEQQQAQAPAPQVAQSPTPAASGGTDLMEQLDKLANMKAAGILSDAEFAAAKAKLLG
ncbi:SHOCT domain-containing protein [Demequina sediminicola]|uniref:SHOCT domain-containing protein n=1 Tax=Demequina sediminicola TaxID=1095026 RepID=UPI0007805B62|nr:SHOCT domain-containing protein [Demequina sediminicola]